MILRDFTGFIRKNGLIAPGQKTILAVSGGLDSVVMARLFREAGFPFAVAHANFSLRGKESDRDEEFTARLATDLNAPFFSRRFDTRTVAVSEGISVQMAARDLRYAWFSELRESLHYDLIATAHHLDDQTETFLINLLRGCGIAGLHGIPVRAGALIRPMLFATREEIEKFALERNIPFRVDSSNKETYYMRNKIRHVIIPALREINPGFTLTVAETTRRLAEFEQVGDHAINEWLAGINRKKKRQLVLGPGHLTGVSPREPYLWKLLSPMGFNEEQVRDLSRLIDRKGMGRFQSAGYLAELSRGVLTVDPNQPGRREKVITVSDFIRSKTLRQPVGLRFSRVTASGYEIPATGRIASLDSARTPFPLTLRPWREGDDFRPLGLNRRKKLSDFFIDCKLSKKQKEETWLLCSGDTIVWVIGHRIDHRYRIRQGTREVLRIEWTGR